MHSVPRLIGLVAFFAVLAPQARAAVWTGTASTRNPVLDDATVTSTSTIGVPGLVSDADAGFCWMTAISGSFRGAGELAVIAYDSVSSHYRAQVKSNTAYDGMTAAGPEMSIKCATLTEFIGLAHVGDFASAFAYVSGTAGGGGNYGQGTDDVLAGSMYPWGGLEGRLAFAGNATWMLSAMDHGTDTAFVRWPNACALSALSDCMISSRSWQTYSSLHTWTYSVTGAAASNNGDVSLISASGDECYVDGVWGEWSSTSSAQVEVHTDGNWHLVTQKGASVLGMGAYASCFPTNQGF